MALYLTLIAGRWLVTRLPARMAYGLAWVAGTTAYVTARSARRNIRANLCVVLDLPEHSRRVRQAALNAFRVNAKNWVDTLRLSCTSPEEVRSQVAVEGWELVESAVTSGKGAIMVGVHLGNVDVVGQIVGARGLPMTVPVEPVRPESLYRLTQGLRQRLGIRTVPAHRAARVLLQVLKRGEIAGLMCDRNVAAGGVEVRFFGRPTLVSRGPAWLARHSGAPVLVGTGRRVEGNRFQGLVTGPLPIQMTDDAEADLAVNAQTIVSAAEGRIRQHPDEWVMFARIWPA